MFPYDDMLSYELEALAICCGLATDADVKETYDRLAEEENSYEESSYLY